MNEYGVVYVIGYYGSSGDGYVGYDNQPCNSVDNAMTFDTEREAKTEMKHLQKQWKSTLYVQAV